MKNHLFNRRRKSAASKVVAPRDARIARAVVACVEVMEQRMMLSVSTPSADYATLLPALHSSVKAAQKPAGGATVTPDDGTVTLPGTGAPLTAAGQPVDVTDGFPYYGSVATFTNPGSGTTPADYSAAIYWGDGSSSAGNITSDGSGGFVVSGTGHAYADPGFSNVYVDIADVDAGDGRTVTATTTSTVADAPLTLNPVSLPTFTEGKGSFRGVLATFVDGYGPGDPNGPAISNVDDLAATIDWGDGRTMVCTIVPYGIPNVYGIKTPYYQTYAKAGTYTATVTVLDNSGTSSDRVKAPVTVLDAPLDASGTTISGEVAGTPKTATVATFNDANVHYSAATDFTASIAWGDGTTSAGTVSGSAGAYSVTGTHAYSHGGTFNATVSILDDDGGSTATATTTVNVANASTTLTAAGATINGVDGRVTTGTVATFSDSSAGSLTASIQWGDGSTTAGTIVNDGSGKYHVTGSHAYAEQNPRMPFGISVSIQDSKGPSATVNSTANISDAILDHHAGTSFTVGVNTTFANKMLGAFRDQDSLATDPSNYTGTIDWGDHTAKTTPTFASAGSTYNVGSYWYAMGGHKYTKKGTYTVVVTVHEKNESQTISFETTITVK